MTPAPPSHSLVDLDIRKTLGRKGTRCFDRATALALLACGQALEDSGIPVEDSTREGIGITLGTTLGSLRSTSDYSRETLEQEKPYLVNPVLFPNTVMNCAAGQAAIWFGLKGVNATIAGGQIAFLGALRYATNALRAGHVDAVLGGAVEELTPHSAWLAHHANPGAAVMAGEGAAVFVLERADQARTAGRHIDAEVLAVVTGYRPADLRRTDPSAAMAALVRRALDWAGRSAGEVSVIATGETGDAEFDHAECGGVAQALRGCQPERLVVKRVVGECQAASGGLQAAAVLALHRRDPSRDGQITLLTGCTPEGGMAAAVLRGWSRVGAASG
jgi:3-oxoacyl-[acyl-carrier-protein] synthase II